MKATEVNELLRDPAARLLDVRTASEFENAHIAGAYNVPLDQLNEHTPELRSARGPVMLICQSGQRAQRAEALLRSAGLANMHVLDGGMDDWTALAVAGSPRPRAHLARAPGAHRRPAPSSLPARIAALSVSPLVRDRPRLRSAAAWYSPA